MKKSIQVYLLPILLLFTFAACNGQAENKLNASNEIKWMSFEQAVAKSQASPKKIFIDISTSWCGWCKKMDASTFVDKEVVSYMNENYYAVRLDAETRDSIRFQDKVFVYRTEYKANELALSLLSGQMSYPSFIFMDEKFAIISPLSGYLTVEQFTPYIKYYGGDFYKKVKFEEFQKSIGN